MNAQQTLTQRYAVQVSPIPKTPGWYQIRFDPRTSVTTQETDASLLAKQVPEAIVVMDKEASFVRWNHAPQDAEVSRKVFEAEACHQVVAEHQKRLAFER